MKTTIEISDPLLEAARQVAGREKTTVRALVEEGLRQVIEGPIQFFALCEHHSFPFYGLAYVGYIADNEIIGISKLTRLVRLFAKRFAVQERIGTQIADALMAMMDPHGVAVYLDAHHLCVEMRGVRESSPITRTTFWRGVYGEQDELRSEFLRICGLGR